MNQTEKCRNLTRQAGAGNFRLLGEGIFRLLARIISTGWRSLGHANVHGRNNINHIVDALKVIN
jgi:hypothetical protein